MKNDNVPGLAKDHPIAIGYAYPETTDESDTRSLSALVNNFQDCLRKIPASVLVPPREKYSRIGMSEQPFAAPLSSSSHKPQESTAAWPSDQRCSTRIWKPTRNDRPFDQNWRHDLFEEINRDVPIANTPGIEDRPVTILAAAKVPCVFPLSCPGCTSNDLYVCQACGHHGHLPQNCNSGTR